MCPLTRISALNQSIGVKEQSIAGQNHRRMDTRKAVATEGIAGSQECMHIATLDMEYMPVAGVGKSRATLIDFNRDKEHAHAPADAGPCSAYCMIASTDP